MNHQKDTELPAGSGSLYVVSLPIGNIGDLTARARQMLIDCDYVVAEDTRQVYKLVSLLQMPKLDVRSYRDQNHDRVAPEIIADLLQGRNIALVSDRGTPTISDPGYKLVRDASEAGVTVTAVPGATAAMAALSISGLPTDKFVFLGFLPRKTGKQKAILQQLQEFPATIIIYESPYRIVKTLQSIAEVLGEHAQVVLAKELTKLHEQTFAGQPAELIAQFAKKSLRGEWVILVNAHIE